MIEWLLNFLKNMLVGLIAIGAISVVFFNSAVMALGESDIKASQVSTSAPVFDYRPTGYSLLVSADVEIVNRSDKDITDFDSTLTVYDCPTRHSAVETCDLVGTDEYGFDGSLVKPVQSGIPYKFSHQYEVKNNIKPSGVFVSKLVVAGFQG